MKRNRILSTLAIAAAFTMGCNPDIKNTTEQVTGSCAEILAGKNTNTYEFWLKFVENQHPINAQSSFVELYDKLQSLESDETIGYIARAISGGYTNDPPEGTENTTTWVKKQMQQNLAAIFLELRKMNGEIGEEFMNGIQKFCMKQTT